MFTLFWLKDAGERALKTCAQSLLATLTLNGVDILHLDWGRRWPPRALLRPFRC